MPYSAAGANKSAKRQFREVLAKAKSYDGIAEHIGGIDGGEEVLRSVSEALSARSLGGAIAAEEVEVPVVSETERPPPSPRLVLPPSSFEDGEGARLVVSV